MDLRHSLLAATMLFGLTFNAGSQQTSGCSSCSQVPELADSAMWNNFHKARLEAVQGQSLTFSFFSQHTEEPWKKQKIHAGDHFEVLELVSTLVGSVGLPIKQKPVKVGDVLVTTVFSRYGIAGIVDMATGKYTGRPITPAMLKAKQFAFIY